jgi:hypothetical protein
LVGTRHVDRLDHGKPHDHVLRRGGSHRHDLGILGPECLRESLLAVGRIQQVSWVQ